MRLSGVRTPTDDTLVDLLEHPTISNNGSLVNPGIIVRRGQWSAELTERILNTAVATVTAVFFQNRFWLASTSVGATPGTRGKRMEDDNAIGWPLLGIDLTDVPRIARLPVRWEWSILVHRDGPLAAADILYEFNLFAMSGTPPAISTVGTFPGIAVSSRGDLNGGRWTVRRRVSQGGALVDTDTGIVAAGEVHRIGIRYDHTVPPRIAAVIDGAEYGAVSGIANMPRNDVAGSNFWSMAIVQNDPTGTAGQVDRHAETRINVKPLPGFVA